VDHGVWRETSTFGAKHRRLFGAKVQVQNPNSLIPLLRVRGVFFT
jgi:hypothetical protein